MDLLRRMASWADHRVAGNPLWSWTTALLVAMLVLVVLLGLRRALGRSLRARSERTNGPFSTLLADLVGRVWVVVLLFAALWAGASILALPARLQGLLRSALLVLALIQAGLWANALLGHWLERRLHAQTDGPRSTAALMLGVGGRLLVWTFVFLMSLQNVGVDVTALIAGLGVGGVAVALAVQNVLGDLFGSVAIALDKPFEIGDFIILGDCMGTVEHIGLKTTRVRSLFGEQIVISNSDLLASRIRNYKRMRERRVVFSVSVTYQTPPEKLETMPSMLQEIVAGQSDVRFDRAHFQKFGESALVFEVVYYVLSPDYNLFMDRQQAINLAICRRFADLQIDFAHPTQTVVLSRVPRREPDLSRTSGSRSFA